MIWETMGEDFRGARSAESHALPSMTREHQRDRPYAIVQATPRRLKNLAGKRGRVGLLSMAENAERDLAFKDGWACLAAEVRWVKWYYRFRGRQCKRGLAQSCECSITHSSWIIRWWSRRCELSFVEQAFQRWRRSFHHGLALRFALK